VRAQSEERGVVYLLEGVGGYRVMTAVNTAALEMSGFPHEIRTFHWGHGWGRFFLDLMDPENVEARSAELAAMIKEVKRQTPNRPVYLVAHSGGNGVAVKTAEKLPPNTLRRVVLLAPAVSPEYDLRRALLACECGIVSHYSAGDMFFLGWGTRQFGTMDREYTESAGRVGFRVPPGLKPCDAELYKRLVQIPWQPRMLLSGHLGTHVGSALPTFWVNEVAPWLR
jgi:pimeloyl-ACP methyl ester carboxylesterase